MLNRGFFLDALRKRVVFTRLNRKEMLRTSAELRAFEHKYFDVEMIPNSAVIKFLRNSIRQQISELLETNNLTRLTISEKQNQELYDIWHGTSLED